MENEKYIPFQMPGYISKVTTLANSLRLTIDTQENLSPEAEANLMRMRNQLGWFSFNIHQIEATDLVDLPPIKKIEKDDKSPSTRLRAVFYRMWQQDDKGYKTPDDHYRFMMEQLINYYKDKLE